MAIGTDCISHRVSLPVIPCGNTDCPWFLHEAEFCNCFWVLATAMAEYEDFAGFSIAEIAMLERCSESTVQAMIETATQNIRIKHRRQLLTVE